MQIKAFRLGTGIRPERGRLGKVDLQKKASQPKLRGGNVAKKMVDPVGLEPTT